MECIEGPNRQREGQQSSLEHRWYELEKRDPSFQLQGGISVRATKTSGIQASPELILE